MSQKVAIVGYGYVGQAYHLMFPEAKIYDPYYDKSGFKTSTKKEVNSCDLAIICVPTPTSEDGMSCDTGIVEDTFKWLRVPVVVIKSTVTPGTTERLDTEYKHGDVCFSPEYIGEGGYFMPYWKYPDPKDPRKHDFMIVGGKKTATSRVVDIFIRHKGPHTKFMQVDAKTAEIIKYTENMWIATKVTFVNEMYDVCKAMGVDWNDVREGWLMDTRVDRNFTAVFVDKRGFEGKCLPKDTKAIVHASKESGYEPKFLQDVIDNNNRIREEHGFEEV